MDTSIIPYTTDIDIEKVGSSILESNKFFNDLCSLMKNREFINFYDEYFKDWSDIQCMIFYMKLYMTIEYEYKQRYNIEITDNIMAYMLRQIMSTNKTRCFALDMFKDFKDVCHANTGSFRSLLNFEDFHKQDNHTKQLLDI